MRALKGTPRPGPGPVDRARAGSKHHVVIDGRGIPLTVTLTGGNRNDITQLIPLLEAIPAVRGRRGRPRHQRGRCGPTVSTTTTNTAPRCNVG